MTYADTEFLTLSDLPVLRLPQLFMKTLSKLFQQIEDSENIMVLGFSICLLVIMGQVFFVLAKNAYVYYVDGVTTKAVIVQVTEGRKYDTDLHKTVSWLDAEAEYEHGTINCRVKLDRIPTSQSGYDTYRKGRHVSVYYLPQMPCSGKSEPFRNISFVIMMGGFCILLGSFLIYYIGRKVRS